MAFKTKDGQVVECVEFGLNSYGDIEVFRFDETTRLIVGNYSCFGPGVRVLLGGEHRKDWVSVFPFNVFWPEAKELLGHPMSRGDIVLGSDVWVGAGAMLLSGSVIGDGACVAAGTVVNGNVAPYSIVAGNPMRHAGYRFETSVVARLLAIRWWAWPRERIAAAIKMILSPNIEDFIAAVERGEL